MDDRIRITGMQMYVEGRAVEPEAALREYDAQCPPVAPYLRRLLQSVGTECTVQSLMPASRRWAFNEPTMYVMPDTDAILSVAVEKRNLEVYMLKNPWSDSHNIAKVAELQYEAAKVQHKSYKELLVELMS